mgnify:CR=1 FL=1
MNTLMDGDGCDGFVYLMDSCKYCRATMFHSS